MDLGDCGYFVDSGFHLRSIRNRDDVDAMLSQFIFYRFAVNAALLENIVVQLKNYT